MGYYAKKPRQLTLADLPLLETDPLEEAKKLFIWVYEMKFIPMASRVENALSRDVQEGVAASLRAVPKEEVKAYIEGLSIANKGCRHFVQSQFYSLLDLIEEPEESRGQLLAPAGIKQSLGQESLAESLRPMEGIKSSRCQQGQEQNQLTDAKILLLALINQLGGKNYGEKSSKFFMLKAILEYVEQNKVENNGQNERLLQLIAAIAAKRRMFGFLGFFGKTDSMDIVKKHSKNNRELLSVIQRPKELQLLERQCSECFSRGGRERFVQKISTFIKTSPQSDAVPSLLVLR